MSVSGVNSQQQINQNQWTTDPTQQTTQAGPGAIGQSGPTPPSDPSVQFGAAVGMAAVMASLAAIMPHVSDDQQEVILAQVTQKLKSLEAKSDNDEVSADTDKKKAALAQKEGKLADASKKTEQAIWDRDHASIWDKIKAVFMAIASALAVVIGALLEPFSGGASTLLIAAGVVGLAASVVMAVDSITQAATGLGIAGNLDKLVHPNDPASWAKADMGFGIAVMIVGIAAALPNLVDGGGEAQIAAMADRMVDLGMMSAKTVANIADRAEAFAQNFAELSSKIASKMADKLGVSMEDAQSIANAGQVANRALGVTSDVADAGMQVASGVYSYQAQTDQAGAKKDQADAKAKEALTQQLDEFIDIALKHLLDASNRWNQMLDGITDAMKDKSDTMQHAKLTG